MAGRGLNANYGIDDPLLRNDAGVATTVLADGARVERTKAELWKLEL